MTSIHSLILSAKDSRSRLELFDVRQVDAICDFLAELRDLCLLSHVFSSIVELSLCLD